MSPGRSRKPLGALVALAVLAGAVPDGRGQPPAGPTRRFVSARDCARCHWPTGRVGEALFAGEPELPALVRLDETKTWAEADKHARAFDALTGRRGRTMGERLGYDDVKAEPACLSCHGTGFLPADPPDLRELAAKSADQGVSCAACHGPYLEWVEAHGLTTDQARRWRLKSPEEKRDRYGMTDLRDPATRAGVCYSCHVGKADEGKVVTHAMYAAGHPPLPSVELATFLGSMPPHWDRPDRVEAFRKDPALRARNRVDFSEPQATRAAVVGGVVALRDAMRLLSASAQPGPTPLGREGAAWPDYARLDCYACHHELQAPGARRRRQARGFDHRVDGLVVRGVAGRPQFRPWPLALARLALAQTGGADRPAFRDAVKDLYAAFDERPFGDPAAVARAAKRLEAWSETALGSLQSTRFDASSPPKLLAALASTPAEEVPDYDSARQVAWAFKAIYADWQPEPPGAGRIAAVLDELDRALKLDPDASRAPRTRLLTTGGLTGDPLRDALSRLSEDEFKTSIARAADYDPEGFAALMRRLSGLLAGAAPQRPVLR